MSDATAAIRPGIINGILIEGVDYSGKTTLANFLLQYCQDVGYRARYGKEFITRSPNVLETAKIAEGLALGFQQDRILAEATILDIRAYIPESILLIQDRHWVSVCGHITFFYGQKVSSYAATLRQVHHRFLHQLYLTSSVAAKRDRIAACPPRSALDAMLAGDPELHQRYDDHMKSILPPDEDWWIIDTSGLSPKAVAARVIEGLGKHRVPSLGAE